jgi:hypothetical protein
MFAITVFIRGQAPSDILAHTVIILLDLQHVATATAINIGRFTDWLNGLIPISSRNSRFADLVLDVSRRFANSLTGHKLPRFTAGW